MTIYVDSVRSPATVGRCRDRRWCHLMSDRIDPTELHEFAQQIGLLRSWFQPGGRLGNRTEHDLAGDHYDVTEAMRRKAVAAGAVEIDRDGLLDLVRRRREAIQAARAVGVGACPATGPTNYVQAIRAALIEQIRATCPSWDIAATPDLLDSYALLVLTVGEAVTREQVHDAWSLWSNRIGPVHRYLVPFAELPPAIQAQDEVGRAAIAAVARARAERAR